MNFGSEFALHDSDDEEEEVREDAPAGPLSSLSSGPSPIPAAGMFNPPPATRMIRPPPPALGAAPVQQKHGGPSLARPPPAAPKQQTMFYTTYNEAAPGRNAQAQKTVRWNETTKPFLPDGGHWPMVSDNLRGAWERPPPAGGGGVGVGGGGGDGDGGGGGGGGDGAGGGVGNAYPIARRGVPERARRAAALAEPTVETPSQRDPNPTQREFRTEKLHPRPSLIGGVPKGGTWADVKLFTNTGRDVQPDGLRDPIPTTARGAPPGKGGVGAEDVLGDLGIEESEAAAQKTAAAAAYNALAAADSDDNARLPLFAQPPLMVGTGAESGAVQNKKKGDLQGTVAPPPPLPLHAPILKRAPPPLPQAAVATAQNNKANVPPNPLQGVNFAQLTLDEQRLLMERAAPRRETRRRGQQQQPDEHAGVWMRRHMREMRALLGEEEPGGYVRGWEPPLPPGAAPADPSPTTGQQLPRPNGADAAATAAFAAANTGAGAGERRAAVEPPRSRTWTRKVDTNILNVDMAALGNAAPYATGDPTICSGCRACLSAVSVLTPVPNTPTTTTTAAAAAATAAGNQSSGAGKGGASLKFSSPLLPSPATCGGGSAVAGGENANSGAKAEDDAEGEGRGDFVEGVYDWACEYCGEVNRVELDDMEKPIKGQDSVDYIVEMAPISTAVARSGKGADDDKDESTVLFVIDTSGSMCVTTAVEGKLSLRGDRTKDMSRLLASGDDRSQFMPGQKRGMTYVSRLQSMQAAIDAQLQAMAKDTPSRLAGLVTFNAEVSLIGDGSNDSRVVAGDRLSDGEALREVGRAYPLSQPVSETRERLGDRLFALEEGGPTALGPAVVVGLSMLKERGGRGSRLVLCTDGLANVGLGALDDLKGDEEREAAEKFYQQLGTESVENGVTIDVVSVDSDACDLENLGTLADKSGGTITRVKAAELASNFAGILANPILASKVSVRVTLHKGLKFRNADVGDDANTLDREIGNVTRETELNFEYQVRRKVERQAMGIKDPGVASTLAANPGAAASKVSAATAASAATPAAATPAATATAAAATAAAASPFSPPPRHANTASVHVEVPEQPQVVGMLNGKGPMAATQGKGAPALAEKSQDRGSNTAATTAAVDAAGTSTTPAFLPFQVQIRYTRPDGMKCMRVLTRTQKVTRSKKEAEGSMSMAVVAGHAASQAGSMASRGAYQSTRVSMRAWSNLMTRNSDSQKAQEQVKRFGSEMAALDNEILEAQTSEISRPGAKVDEGGAVNDETESATLGRNRKSARSGNDSLSFHAYRAKSNSSKGYH